MKGITGENLLSMLERRLENAVYRLGLATSRAAARMLVRHPLMTAQVTSLIHLQGVKLWLRGAKFHRMPLHGLYTDRVTKR